jgi:uncharacterized membrane protein YeiH
MLRIVCVLVAVLLFPIQHALACSGAELTQKMKLYSDAVKVAYAKDPGSDQARQAQVQAIIARYSDLKKSINGAYIIDMLCKENDELLAVYK